MKIFLQSERLTLRPFTEADADLLIDLDSDPEVMRHISEGRPTPPEEIRNRVLPLMLRFHAAYDDLGFWAAHQRESGAFIGWFHFRPAYDASQGMELGYRLKRSAWGQGYATEGSRALLHRAFAATGVRRVIARTMKTNTRSAHVMEKLGMRLELEFIEERFPGADKTAVQYVVTREEFLARQR